MFSGSLCQYHNITEHGVSVTTSSFSPDKGACFSWRIIETSSILCWNRRNFFISVLRSCWIEVYVITAFTSVWVCKQHQWAETRTRASPWRLEDEERCRSAGLRWITPSSRETVGSLCQGHDNKPLAITSQIKHSGCLEASVRKQGRKQLCPPAHIVSLSLLDGPQCPWQVLQHICLK